MADPSRKSHSGLKTDRCFARTALTMLRHPAPLTSMVFPQLLSRHHHHTTYPMHVYGVADCKRRGGDVASEWSAAGCSLLSACFARRQSSLTLLRWVPARHGQDSASKLEKQTLRQVHQFRLLITNRFSWYISTLHDRGYWRPAAATTFATGLVKIWPWFLRMLMPSRFTQTFYRWMSHIDRYIQEGAQRLRRSIHPAESQDGFVNA